MSLKKLQRLLQPKRHVQMGLYLWLSVLTAIYSMMINLYKIAKLNFRLLSTRTNGFHVIRQRLKNLLLRARVVVRTSNMKISRRQNITLKACCLCNRIVLLRRNQCYVMLSFAVVVAVVISYIDKPHGAVLNFNLQCCLREFTKSLQMFVKEVNKCPRHNIRLCDLLWVAPPEMFCNIWYSI